MVEAFPDMGEILAQMKDKFLETANEKLDRINEILQEFEAGSNDDTALIEEFLREIHSLKGMGGTFQMPLVSKLCHDLEAFLAGESSYTPEIVEAAHVYVDRLMDLIESEDASDESKSSEWLANLPKKGQSVAEPQQDSSQQILIVGQEQLLIESISSAFNEVGFQSVVTNSPFEAFQLAVQRMPDVCVVFQKLDGMEGPELLRSLTSIKALSGCKFAMVCPDRRQALDENLQSVQLLSQQKIDREVFNFIAIAVSA